MKNLNTILPFYDALTEQYRYREDVEVQPCQVVLTTTMVPWIIRRTHSATGDVAHISMQLYNLSNVAVGGSVDLSAKVTIEFGTSYDHIIYASAALTALPTGVYYMVVTDTEPTPDKLWYSETFTVVSSVSTYLKFQFSNVKELSSIAAGFVQIVYLNTTLKTPEYLREDTGDKRDGLLVKEKQVTMKSYTLREIVAPEYLVDALMLVPLMDYVTVVAQSGEVMTFDEVRIKDPEWNAEAYGSRAKVEIQLIKDVVVKKLNFKETGYEAGGTVAAIIKQGVGATVADDDVFTYSVVFQELMPDVNYTPAAYVVQTVAPADVQLPYISNITESGFDITTLVACTVKWSAIHV